MIEVRIRHHDEANAVHLCTWPATELDQLLPALAGWGVYHVETGDESDKGLRGSIQVEDNRAYFEVVISGE